MTDFNFFPPKDLRRHLALLEQILNRVHMSVVVLDPDDRIIFYNREAEACEGLKAEKIMGRSAQDAYGDFFYEPAVNKVKKTGKPLLNQRYTGTSWEAIKIDVVYDVYPYFLHNKLTAVYIIGRGLDQITHLIANTLEQQRRVLSKQNQPTGGRQFFLDDLVGTNASFQHCITLARKIAVRDSAILIVGETGSGKDLFAQGLHNASFYADGPFVPVNCAALPESLLEGILFGTVKGAFTGASNLPGLFEQAEDGTLFLDEINSMPLVLQAKLLRVLQEKRLRRLGSQAEIPIRCRIVSATNANPFSDMLKKNIRPDLFFRVANMVLSLPPLRERRDDIGELAQHFVQKFNREFGLEIKKIDPALMEKMRQYYWPGNVRELSHMIENAMNMVQSEETVIRLEHLPEYSQKRLLQFQTFEISPVSVVEPEGLRAQLEAFEKRQIAKTLKYHKGNVTKAAQALGLGRQNLHHKLRKYSLPGPDE